MPNPADAAPGELLLTSDVPGVVLDTNVVLDWLVFREPTVTALVHAVESGRVRWLATVEMRAEFEQVLARGLAASRGVEVATARAAWDRHAEIGSAGSAAGPALCCTDPDDQKFIDFALSSRARWLVSRDRAVLRLQRRALALGLAILAPERWSHSAR